MLRSCGKNHTASLFMLQPGDLWLGAGADQGRTVPTMFIGWLRQPKDLPALANRDTHHGRQHRFRKLIPGKAPPKAPPAPAPAIIAGAQRPPEVRGHVRLSRLVRIRQLDDSGRRSSADLPWSNRRGSAASEVVRLKAEIEHERQDTLVWIHLARTLKDICAALREELVEVGVKCNDDHRIDEIFDILDSAHREHELCEKARARRSSAVTDGSRRLPSSVLSSSLSRSPSLLNSTSASQHQLPSWSRRGSSRSTDGGIDSVESRRGSAASMMRRLSSASSVCSTCEEERSSDQS